MLGCIRKDTEAGQKLQEKEAELQRMLGRNLDGCSVAQLEELLAMPELGELCFAPQVIRTPTEVIPH